MDGLIYLVGLIVVAFLLAGPVYDLVTRRRVHPSYFASVPLAFLAIPPVVLMLSATDAWRAIAAAVLGK